MKYLKAPEYWHSPHISKVYEALTAIADNRIKLTSDTTAKCYSTSGNKFYEVTYDPQTESIMSDDNSAFYTDSLSYPMIAFFMLIKKIAYDPELAEKLKGIPWKKINQEFKNNYDKSVEFVLEELPDKNSIQKQVDKIYQEVLKLKLKPLGKKVRPPKAF